MRKVAIFVEGQTELIFVRQFLLTWFEYQLTLECRNLLKGEDFRRAGHNFANPSANIYILLTNVGMDESVLSRILEREQELYQDGYGLIIGLRDMYSEKYRKVVKNQTIDVRVNDKFRQMRAMTIQKQAKRPESIRFCFAIMELETWWLGISSLWDNLNINTKEQYKKEFAAPEEVFHPAELVNKLFQARGQTYSKRKSEVESLVGQISREHFFNLHASQQCASFCEFVGHLNAR
jgi:hypothetical protein